MENPMLLRNVIYSSLFSCKCHTKQKGEKWKGLGFCLDGSSYRTELLYIMPFCGDTCFELFASSTKLSLMSSLEQ